MNAETKIKRNLDHIQRDLGSLIKQFDVENTSPQSSIKEFGAQGIEQIRAALDSLNGTVQAVSKSLEDTNRKVRGQIQSNPYTSIGCAVGVGALAGFLVELARKKREA